MRTCEDNLFLKPDQAGNLKNKFLLILKSTASVYNKVETQ